MAAGVAVLAHGIGSRQDLPIPFVLAIAGAVVALVGSFVVLALAWRTPRLFGDSGRPLPAWVTSVVSAAVTTWVLRVAGLLAFAYTAMCVWVAPDDFSNPAAGLLYVVFWLGLVPASLLLGPVWRVMNPVRTLHLLLARALGRAPEDAGLRPLPAGIGCWPAAAGLLGFAWLELVSPGRTTTAAIGTFLGCQLAVQVAGVVAYGSRWLDRGDAFEVFSGLFGRLSPFGRRGSDGRVVLRNPLANLDGLRAVPGMAATVCVLLGSTAYDSVSSSPDWVRWTQSGPLGVTLGGTVGLLGSVGLVLAAYLGATAAAARLGGQPAGEMPGRFAHSLVPIVLGYFVAHYLTLFVIEGQRAIIAASDPFSDGSDWFGTARRVVDQSIGQQTTLIATVQVCAVVAGHVLGAISAHDRSTKVFGGRRATVSQLPLLAVMVVYTVTGLLLLFAS